jgi:peptide/nickel transport system permease protein
MRASRLDPMLLLATVLGFGLLAVALFGERLAPNEDIYFVVEHGNDPRPFDPGVVFPFGSDVLGRDLFSLVLAGAGTTLAIVVLAGFARVAAGVLVAALGGWWRPARVLTESLAQLVSAIPATVLALVLVKVFVKSDTTVLVFIGALLVIGWAGPYRVIRAELDRVARAPFTEGARVIGVSRWRLLWRHQLPHLLPVVAINFTQQVIAALVLVAELGVIGVLVGATRFVDLQESVSSFAPGVPNGATIADTPEWGGLLAGSRSVLALYVTRWLILIPGIAVGLTAVTVALIGFGLARRYARRDVITDIRGKGALAIAIAVVAFFVASGLIPERYAEAREWATSARSHVSTTPDLASAFADAAVGPVGETYSVGREVTNVSQNAPASVRVGGVELSESPWPRRLTDIPDRQRNVRALVTSGTGGGVVEAPLVFAGRGIAPSEYTIRQQPLTFPQPDVAKAFRDLAYEDDYANIDVRGKVVLLVRFFGIEVFPPGRIGDGIARGPVTERMIAGAVERGAVAVVFVDPALWLYTGLDSGATYCAAGGSVRSCFGGAVAVRGGPDPYLRLERAETRTDTGGIPVVVISEVAARQLLDPLGLDVSRYYDYDRRGPSDKHLSLSRDLGITARVEVPLAKQTTTVSSLVGEVSADPDSATVVVWAPRRPDAQHPTRDVLAALARALGSRGVPLVLVDFDLSVDPRENAKHLARAFGDRRIELVVVLDKLDGSALRITTPYGEYIPAFDLYAEKAQARFETTRGTARMSEIESITPFLTTKTVVVTGTGGDGDLRGDAAALVGYLAGRLAFGAPELPR